MIDFLRNLAKSDEEKQQEALAAYLDDALSPNERQQFEQRLAEDAVLQAALAQARQLQLQMRQLPRRRVPRNFTLDPSVYGRPQRQPLFQLYPVMRTAAVLTAFFFILAVAADLFMVQGAAAPFAPQQDVALVAEEAVEEPLAEEITASGAANVVEVTRVTTETVGEAVIAEEEAAADLAFEAPAEESSLEEPAAVEGEVAAEQAEEAPMAAAEPMLEESDAAPEVSDTQRALATPSPAPTTTVPAAIAATKSTIPRPSTETVPDDRAVTPDQPAATAIPDEVNETNNLLRIVDSWSGLRLLQIGLGVLFIMLATAVIYVRRQS